MKTSCLLLLFIAVSLQITNAKHEHATVESSLYKERHRRSPELEETLHRMRSLLRDPVDEEHDEVEKESDDTHALTWTVQIDSDNDDDARELAKKYAFDYVSKVEGITEGLYRFSRVISDTQKEDIIKKARESLPGATDDGIKANVNEDIEKTVSKRDHIETFKRFISDDKVKWCSREKIFKREKRAPMDHKPSTNVIGHLDDPQLRNEWYIRNVGQTTGPASFDSRVAKVWDMGYTGKGQVLSVLDDGMDHSHPDLKRNYDPEASKDLNSHDDDPMPNDSDPYNAHGTKCAGTIAAEADNGVCGVGIAYNAKVGAIRMLDGKATDGLEADALSFHRDHIDIYSCSWGPRDNGQTFGRPGPLGRIALAQGAMSGRKGRGSLYIWATGNGGMMTDDCNADGYVNSIYTLGIGSVNEHGVSTYYGEQCPSMMAVTYCSGKHKSTTFTNANANVITTYLHHQCTNHFVGTSSAAPLAAAIFALVLEANPLLSWRDVQHLVYHTAVKTSPMDLGWKENGCGKPFNHKFGFGVLDAEKLVVQALNWTNVAPQKSCHFRLNFSNGDIPSEHHFKLSFKTDGCQTCKGSCKHSVHKLEHVVVNVTLKHRRRGDLSIALVSPSGTLSHLLHVRPYDSSSSGLKGWTFMTLFNWCEDPKGTWQLIFKDNKGLSYLNNARDTRDLEEEYINILDKRKENEKRKLVKKEDDDTENVSVNEEKQTYDEVKHAYNEYQSRKREVERDYYPGQYQQRSDDDGYYNQRKRREVDDDEDYERKVAEDDKTDYVQYKKSTSDFERKFDDTTLGNGILAGEVEAISITFYGT